MENHFLNAYSPDMKKLSDEYFKTKGQLDETFSLFISDKLEASTQGLMPQGYAAGFISSTASAQVYAHELAHGVFNFDHSWLMYDLDSMKTQNLMDYSGGTELWYRQWKQMVSPGFPKGWRKDEKDGKFAGKFVLTPDNKFAYIKETNLINISQVSGGQFGALPGFVLTDKDKKKTYYLWENGVYYCNEQKLGNTNVTIKEKLEDEEEVYLFYNIEEGCKGGAYVVVTGKDYYEYKSKDVDGSYILKLIQEFSAKTGKGIACYVEKQDSNSSDWQTPPIDCNQSGVVDIVQVNLDNVKKISKGQSAEETRDILQKNYLPGLFQ